MKKTVLKLGLSALLATNLLVLAETVPGFNGVVFAADAAKVAMPAEAKGIKGKISNISQKAKNYRSFKQRCKLLPGEIHRRN